MLDEDEEQQPGDDKDTHDRASFVPVAARKLTEEESVRKSVPERQSPASEQILP